jgi:membrane fusion protein (multidrug efflux system)
MMKFAWMVSAIVVLALAGCSDEKGPMPGPGFGPGGMAAGPVEVGVLVAKSGPVSRDIDLPGRVVASATAEVRPQVDGIVRKIVFDEGRKIAAGDVLFELDDRKFQASVASAKASLQRAEAETTAKQSAVERNEKLAATNAVSTQTLDDARTALLQAQADEEIARANLASAQISLDDATIRAPIDGVIGVSTVSVGSLVTANQTTAMATIRQVDPIHVDLVDSSANLLRVRDEGEAGRLGREPGVAPAVTLTLENGRDYSEKGELKLADMVISRTSGTFSLRSTFANPDGLLLPGMFVRAKVNLGSVADAFLIPQLAVQRTETGDAALFVVSSDDKAEKRIVETSGSIDNNWVVVSGVETGDRVIIDGFQKISEGSSVKPVEARVGDDGSVRQTIPAASTKTEAPKP